MRKLLFTLLILCGISNLTKAQKTDLGFSISLSDNFKNEDFMEQFENEYGIGFFWSQDRRKSSLLSEYVLENRTEIYYLGANKYIKKEGYLNFRLVMNHLIKMENEAYITLGGGVYFGHRVYRRQKVSGVVRPYNRNQVSLELDAGCIVAIGWRISERGSLDIRYSPRFLDFSRNETQIRSNLELLSLNIRYVLRKKMKREKKTAASLG